MGLLDALFGKSQDEKQERAIVDAMSESGWTPWEPGATKEERHAALMACLERGRIDWHPPKIDTPDGPPDTSGKLSVDSPRKRLFGLF